MLHPNYALPLGIVEKIGKPSAKGNSQTFQRIDWHPDCRDIVDCDGVENWQLSCRGYGPYMLQGTVAGHPCLTGLIAIDMLEMAALEIENAMRFKRGT